jgi:hypothetical protein
MPTTDTRFEALASQQEVDPSIKLTRPDKRGVIRLLTDGYAVLREELTLIALAILVIGGGIVATFATALGLNFFGALAIFIMGGIGIMALIAAQS